MNETPHTVGIIGYPLDSTLSPAIHNAAFRAQQLPFVYLPFVVAPRHLRNLLRCMRLMDVDGLNVTAPHKTAVGAMLPRLDTAARRIGAVNTIVREGDTYVGYNTDGAGFLAALRRTTGRPTAPATVTVIGAGGAARAVAYAVCTAGAKHVCIANRTPRRARTMAKHLAAQFPKVAIRTIPLSTSALKKIFAATELLIQATSASPTARTFSLPLAALPKHAMVVDLRYGATPTQTMRDAKRLRLRHCDGLAMLVEQAAISFALWTGKTMDVAKAHRTAQRALRHIRAE